MILHVEDNNEVVFGVHDDEVNLRAGDTINLGSSDYNDLTNKPSINEVELVGDVSLDDLGVAYAEDIPTDVSELTNDAGYITSEDIPPIPEKRPHQRMRFVSRPSSGSKATPQRLSSGVPAMDRATNSPARMPASPGVMPAITPPVTTAANKSPVP